MGKVAKGYALLAALGIVAALSFLTGCSDETQNMRQKCEAQGGTFTDFTQDTGPYRRFCEIDGSVYKLDK